MTFSLSIRQRLLVSHLFAVVLLAGAFGAYLYHAAAREVMIGLRAQLLGSAALIGQSLDAATLDASPSPTANRNALVAQLQDAARSNSDLALIYLLRRDGDGAHVVAATDDGELAERMRATGAPAGITEMGERAALSDGFFHPAITPVLSAAPADRQLIAFAPVPRSEGRYAVGVEMRAAQVSERLRILRLSALLSFLVCVLAALLLSRLLAGRFQGTIGDLVTRCRALANGEPLPPRKAGRRDEFDNLAREFDAMSGRLRHTHESRERAYAAVREANERLETRVRERTSELEGVNLKLKDEIESRLHVEALLAEAALTDPLTGLLNRRAMMEMLGQASTGVKQGGAGMSVILADIDHFKRVNDQHGHAVGDQVLAAVAGVVREFFGEHQHNAARWGGEEFLILLPGMRLAAACKRAGMLRQHINDLRTGHLGLHVSVSLGVAEFIPGEPLDACLRRCDQALYRAKDAGRNTVVAAQGALFATMS